jgi:uncharacterized protein
VIVDANLLLFSVDTRSPFHARALEWLESALNGTERVGFPWTVLTAFLRIATHPRALERPLGPGEAWRYVADWLACDVAWTPTPTDRHADVLGSLIESYQLRGNLVSDADLAALAIEHGVAVCSADSDFARFREVRWLNPLSPE